MNCSRAQEFYSLIVLNVPCWLSQGLLQRLDPRAVWVYGLRYRRGGTPRYAKPSYFFQVFSSAVEASARCVYMQGCFLLIFMCLNIFNHDLYKLERSPHFLLLLQTDIESHSPAWGFILSQMRTPHRLLKDVCKCLLCFGGATQKEPE